jgi:UDP-N-acetylglucosamine acyltransferase
VNSNIHPSAIIAEGAMIHPEAKVGPFCVVGEHVSIGAGCELISHVVVTGHTTLGRNNRIFPFASIGSEPQDLKYHGEPSRLIIGDDNIFRENTTVNPGTEAGGMLTRIGNGNLLMAYAHVAHDCLLGNGIVLANCATLAGHVEVGDGAIIGGLAAVHQQTRIGKLAMLGGMSGVVKDVPPFCMIAGGYRAGLSGLNLVGLRRAGFDSETITLLRRLYRIFFQSRDKMELRLKKAEAIVGENPAALELYNFVQSARKGLCLHRDHESKTP